MDPRVTLFSGMLLGLDESLFAAANAFLEKPCTVKSLREKLGKHAIKLDSVS